MTRKVLGLVCSLALGVGVAACGSSTAPGVQLAPSAGQTAASVTVTPTTPTTTTTATVTPTPKTGPLSKEPVLNIPKGPAPTHVVKIDLIKGTGVTQSPQRLLAVGGLTWVGNNLAFGFLYWMLDSGGPIARMRNPMPIDFAFTQQMSPELAPPGWRPVFLDYLHLGFTNATAFSPTDVMPLTHRAKYTMLVQSTVALALFGLIVARAVNAFT